MKPREAGSAQQDRFCIHIRMSLCAHRNAGRECMHNRPGALSVPLLPPVRARHGRAQGSEGCLAPLAHLVLDDPLAAALQLEPRRLGWRCPPAAGPRCLRRRGCS